ncbi:hypothetical protein SAMN04487982_110211 [Streptomyces sp. ok210]|nr:hypothetical protein SAMN04487982_110211 [Streptomyces sp. ok210]
MPELWAGTDAGKAAHHCTVIDTAGTKLLSRRVPNNEAELLELIGDLLAGIYAYRKQRFAEGDAHPSDASAVTA